MTHDDGRAPHRLSYINGFSDGFRDGERKERKRTRDWLRKRQRELDLQLPSVARERAQMEIEKVLAMLAGRSKRRAQP